MEKSISAGERSVSRTPWNHRTPLQRSVYSRRSQKEFSAVRLEERARLAPHDGKFVLLLGRCAAELAGGRLPGEIQPTQHRALLAAIAGSHGFAPAGTPAGC